VIHLVHKMAHSLKCVMEIVTDSFNGKPKYARVCSYCARDNNEGPFLTSYLNGLTKGKGVPITHGICESCYQKELEKLKLV